MIGKIHVESSYSYEKSECETTELAAEAGEGEPTDSDEQQPDAAAEALADDKAGANR